LICKNCIKKSSFVGHYHQDKSKYVEANSKHMVWLNPNGYEEQEYVELRLNAPKNEKIFLDFNPLKISDTPD
jgi:hypothetical protein